MAAAIDRAAGRPWPVLAAWTALWGTVHGLIWSGRGWLYFAGGSRLLFSPAGLQLYAHHPELQIGPLTFAVVAPLEFALRGHAAEFAAMALMTGAGLVVLAQVRRLQAAAGRVGDRTFLAAGLCFLLVWPELAVTYAHPDDALAILGAVLAVRLLAGGRPGAAALLLGLAAGCKPWALALVPLLLLAERRAWPRVFAGWAVTVVVPWLPFAAAGPATLAVARYRLGISPASPLRMLGVHAAAPLWDRPVQLALGIALGVLAVRRGQGGAVIVAVLATRLLLDPSVKSYYDAGLLAGAVLYDLAVPGRRVPVLTLSVVGVLYLPMFALADAPALYAALRTGYLLTVIGMVAWRRPGEPEGARCAPDRASQRTAAPSGLTSVSRSE